MSQATLEQKEQKKESNGFIDCTEAGKIMGDNFLDPQKVHKEIKDRYSGFLAVPPGDEFENIPISEAELRKYSRHFILMPGFELCIEDFFSVRAYDLGFELEDAWYLSMAFAAEERVNRCWYLIRSSPVPDSIGKIYHEMRQYLGPDEEIPRACELLYAVFFYCVFSEGVHLYRGRYPICRDLIYKNCRPHLGFFPGGKLDIRYYDSYSPDPKIGLVPIRKLIVP